MFEAEGKRKSLGIRFAILALIATSLVLLSSIGSFLFPLYFLYIAVGIFCYYLFSKVDFVVLTVFYKHFYILSLVFLVLPLLVGQITRGAIRWIPLGALTIQPAEIIRPFLMVFFAVYIAENRKNLNSFLKSVGWLAIPLFLILIQPSLGVAIISAVGYFGIFIASGFNKKAISTVIALVLLTLPLSWFVLAPYQKNRIISFIDPAKDPLGAGYNSIQSMVAVGAGGLWGRGLGEGVQTQLAFLPEKHTDFVFAAAAEELGLLGAATLAAFVFALLYSVASRIERAKSPVARTFITGMFFMLFTQTVVNIGMNLGLLPITGLPLPLVSAGGSSLIGTLIMLGMVEGASK